MLTETEHLLVCLGEECQEIAKEAAKALRFGLDDTDPTIPNSPNQRIAIVSEFNDLMAVMEMLSEKGELKPPDDLYRQIEKKKIKVRHFMEYAREHGTLLPANVQTNTTS